MRDRTPTRALENGALRYGVYAEDGSLLRYEYLALEDDPTDPGTELSKATLLQDSTEVSLFGSAADRTVDDAFAGIAGQLNLIKSDMAAITLTVQDTNGKPIPEVLVQGILSESGQAVYTNASGVAAGYIGEGAQVIKVSGYADVADHSETLTVVKGTSISKTWKLTTVDFLRITASKSIKFSGNVQSVDGDIGAAGGGGGGGYGDGWSGIGSYHGGGNGGAGGNVVSFSGLAVVPNQTYAIVVGTGGAGGKNVAIRTAYGGENTGNPGGKGGNSSGFGYMATGGEGGLGGRGGRTPANGNGNGGIGAMDSGSGSTATAATKGGDGTKTMHTAFNATTPYGGGGGGALSFRSTGSVLPGGEPGGGKGGSDRGNGSNGTAYLGGGGGGGGGYFWYDDGSIESGGDGGKGGSGCVAIRMHLKSAA